MNKSVNEFTFCLSFEKSLEHQSFKLTYCACECMIAAVNMHFKEGVW